MIVSSFNLEKNRDLKMKKLFYTITLVYLINGCAHYPDVRPSGKGLHKVSFLTERKNEGFQEGFSQAKDYCDDVHNKRAVHVSEKSKYVGSMDEDKYNRYKTASKVTTAVGSAGYVFGGKRQQDVGGIAMLGGGIADSAIGKGYRYTMKFRCK